MLYSRMNKDFDSNSLSYSSTSTMTSVGPNGQITETKQESRSSESKNEQDNIEQEYYTPPKSNYEEPEQLYTPDNPIVDAPTYRSLNSDENKEQSEVSNEADAVANMKGNQMRSLDQSEGEHMTDEFERLLYREFDSSNLDRLDPNQETIDEQPDNTISNIDSLITLNYTDPTI